MSWFKKILQRFQNDPEKSIQNEKIIPRNHQESDSSKTVHAKVSYQYPKGAFRFPVIPDKNGPDYKPPKQPVVVPQQEKIHKETPIVNRPAREQRKKDIGQPFIQNKQNPLIGIRQKEQGLLTREKPSLPNKSLREKFKPEIRRSGPFKPTEIPSPIFGYERPKQIKVVEHELSGFLKEKELNSANDENIQSNQHDIIQEAKEFDNTLKKMVENETISVAEEEVSAASESVLEEVAEEYTKPSSEKTDNNIEPAEINQEVEPVKGDQSQKRSHLPFNVLMLKQDRIKLEQKKIRHDERMLDGKKNEDPIKIDNEQLVLAKSPAQNDELKKAEPSAGSEGSGTLLENSKDQPYFEMNRPIRQSGYFFPAADLLTPPVSYEENSVWLQDQEELLNQTLTNFNVGAKVVNVTQGPSVTRFEVQPDPGVKVNKITNLSDDIKLSLAARDIRIEAPIPGKHTIGIEVPNENSRPVLISEILFSPQFNENESPLTAALGLDISGKPVVTDLRKMPHGLIAGATGSGKSVCINTMLVSLLYKANPQDVKLLLIDPKMVELAPYNHIPHLVSPVITDVKAATAALKWAVDEMERRYELFAHTGVREITRFNEMAEAAKRYSDKLPYIIIVIDELADLMMVSPADVEEAICRIAQKARACGIHLVVATQRPSVDVITGLIKANIPTRIAFSVSSQVDSRTIIDISGAEKLLGRGDMLFLENGSSKPVRLQGTYISDIEIDKVVEHVRKQGEPEYLFEQTELIKKAQATEEEDELFYEACEFVIEQGGASTSSLQRRFKIGYNRAARLIDLMEEQGFISEARGSKPRDVLITEADLDSI